MTCDTKHAPLRQRQTLKPAAQFNKHHNQSCTAHVIDAPVAASCHVPRVCDSSCCLLLLLLLLLLLPSLSPNDASARLSLCDGMIKKTHHHCYGHHRHHQHHHHHHHHHHHLLDVRPHSDTSIVTGDDSKMTTDGNSGVLPIHWRTRMGVGWG